MQTFLGSCRTIILALGGSTSRLKFNGGISVCAVGCWTLLQLSAIPTVCLSMRTIGQEPMYHKG